MPGKKFSFIDSITRQESIGGLGARLVLTGKEDAAADALGELSQQGAQSLAVPSVLEPAARDLPLQPTRELFHPSTGIFIPAVQQNPALMRKCLA